MSPSTTARVAPPVDPACSALLVIDMQVYFEAICAPIVAAVRRAVDACRARGVPVLFTQHGHADPAIDGGALGRWWGDLIIEGTPDHRLLSSLGRRAEDPVIAKRRYSAFHQTALARQLSDLGVEDLAVAGVMTNLCVETTARDAFVRDFCVRVLVDATATADPAMQRASLLNLGYGFAYLQTTAEWIAALDAG